MTVAKARAAVVLVDIEDVIGSLRVRVQIERRSETPAGGHQKEPMVPQVIVSVADCDVECEPPEELLEIGNDMMSAHSIEAPHAESMVLTAEAMQLRCGNDDPRSGRKSLDYGLPGFDIARVVKPV